MPVFLAHYCSTDNCTFRIYLSPSKVVDYIVLLLCGVLVHVLLYIVLRLEGSNHGKILFKLFLSKPDIHAR